jgi:hypothetical protein
VDYNLSNMVESSRYLNQIFKSRLKTGDDVFLKTSNSTYFIRVLEKGQYLVSGGWFDNNHLSPLTTTIHGCTWGGNIIKADVIAACGLHLEFGNRVLTSKIKKIFHIPAFKRN